ncbi:MAG TPA: sulfite exporter TauE/SafE family protein [Tepidisphaeraceae bacterium]|nr:sulfite exporter TauE/SafE family protein [Tepidisphaeraceae bacterium]
MGEPWLLIGLIFVAAIVYSSVGHAGASGYLAAMALVGVAPEVMRPAAMTLNILVASIGSISFYRAGHFSWRTLWPFAAGSVPFAFIGGSVTLPGHVFRPLLGLVLIVAAVRMIVRISSGTDDDGVHPPRVGVAVASGAGIGLLSGLTGTGGGIFLSPLMLIMRWAEVRKVAGTSVVFILVNSLSGLAGNVARVQVLPTAVIGWAAAAVIGGAIGAYLGSRKLAPQSLRYLLALVLLIAAAKLILS